MISFVWTVYTGFVWVVHTGVVWTVYTGFEQFQDKQVKLN